jgi:hypothetical protein
MHPQKRTKNKKMPNNPFPHMWRPHFSHMSKNHVFFIYEVTDRHIRGLIINQPIEEPAIDAIYRDSFREASATLTQVQTNKNGMRFEMRRLHLTQVQKKEDKREGVEIRLVTRRFN